MTIRVGHKATWNWGAGSAQGKVVGMFTEDVTRSRQGAEITRNATSDKPAYLIQQDDGAQVLKSCTEIETA